MTLRLILQAANSRRKAKFSERVCGKANRMPHQQSNSRDDRECVCSWARLGHALRFHATFTKVHLPTPPRCHIVRRWVI